MSTETLAGSKSFSETLREGTEPKWSSAVDHRFVAEIHAGTIPDEVLGAYLVQDYRFLDSFLALVGGAIASADTYAARLRLAQFVNAIAVDENDYFQRAFAALGVTDEQLADTPNFVSTGSFIAMFREASRTLDYPAMLSVLLVTQWIYFDWTSKGERPMVSSPILCPRIGYRPSGLRCTGIRTIRNS